jgi:hypothetical protein
MKPTRIYVNQKSDLSSFKAVLDEMEVLNVRARYECECPPGDNRRDAIMAVAPGGCAATFILRCKACKKRKETGHDR